MTRLLLFCFACTASVAQAQQFRISYPASAFNHPFTGKVFLYLSKDNRQPKSGAVGIEFFPAFSVEVKNILPGRPVVIDDKAASYPVPLSDVERGTYYVQAVWDRNLGGRSIAESSANMYSNATRVTFTKDHKKTFAIVCDKVVPEKSFTETQFVKELSVSSKLLSDFHKKPMTLNAAVVLPKEYYTQPARKFPVLFRVFGYGGDYHRLSGRTTASTPVDTFPCIEVMLDGNCALGHSVYANSDNNGPWGDALVKELIPELENKFRCNGARLLTGHSSGGWTVLWLQTQYPSTFAGCWSSSPDPVDFRNFQTINLYNGENMFYAKDSSLRLVATVAGVIPWASQKQVYQAEHVIYRGEQMHSFDAVFSGKGADGNPERICDPATGAVNTKVFDHWKRYDISANVRTNWSTVKEELHGKIRVSVGEGDNFLLNHAVHLFDEEMKKLNAGFEFVYVPGDHFTIHTNEYWNNGMQFLAQRYAEWLKTNQQ